MTETVVSMETKRKKAQRVQHKLEVVTPEMAVHYLDANKNNRPLSQPHVNQIAGEITGGKWQFNGDTIKIGAGGDILDGQHRLWACVLAEKPIETIVVTGLKRDAFTTIDTMRRNRSFGDVLAVEGVTRNRAPVGHALAWLIRWQRGAFPNYKRPEYRVTNRDVAEAWAAHPQMEAAIERTGHCRRIAPPALLGMLFYIFSNHDEDMAERFVKTLESPAGVAVDDPFFVYRAYLLRLKEEPRQRNPVAVLALGIKAWNAACVGRKVKKLSWITQGPRAEMFPDVASVTT